MSQSQNHPGMSSSSEAADPAHNYERAKPHLESPSGSLHQPPAKPDNQPEASTSNGTGGWSVREPSRGDDSDSTSVESLGNPGQVGHSMKDEEPDGWDLAPASIADPRAKRHPRTEGKGGLE